ncbi:hypothetical protein, partial [Neolewinella agarilytica]
MRALFLTLLLPLAISLSAQITPPNDFLPHELGETFTPHHMLVDYFQLVSGQSERVMLEEYGRT